MSLKIVLLLVLFQIVVVFSWLEQVHVLFRHGARTPSNDNTYPNDPYVNDTWYPYGAGALTNGGKLSMFNAGEELRVKYNAFLGEVYNPKDLYARSTSYPRTKMSIQMVLAGLFPPPQIQQWGDIMWQPIPSDYEKYEDDKLLGFPIYYCDDLASEYQNVSHSKDALQYLKDHEADFEYVNNATGLKANTTLDMMSLYMGLKSEELERPLPEWTKEVYPEGFLQDAANYEYLIQSNSDLLVKATGGPLVKKILADVDQKIRNSTTTPKLFLYAAHEYNVAYVLSVLKVFKPHIPNYSSHITFELHRENEKYALKVLYNQGNGTENVLILPGCEEMCDLDKFKIITSNLIPENDWCW